MKDQLSAIRSQLVAFLEQYLSQIASQFPHLEPSISQVSQQLLTFSTSGKMLRGAMTVMVYQMHGGQLLPEAIKAGAALELFQSTLLIHDDIMDQDRMRRDQLSVYAQYEEQALKNNYRQPAHFGISMGICVGDIALFMVQDILASVKIGDDILAPVFRLLAKESIGTGLAQMMDTENGLSTHIPSVEEVRAVNIHKTARYTFCLPFMLGATLAGQSTPVVDKWAQLGETLGLLFQIKDDELGLFGKSAEIGKPAGSDIREHKKTLYYVYLMAAAEPAVKQKLVSIFGNPNLDEEMIEYVREQVMKVGAKAKVDAELTALESQSYAHIDQLAVADEYKAALRQFVQFNLLRKR
ncbi:MAG TPA: polyprenyl synthetase family protein [Vitreimonas sp.]|nr:polyprenyl synthetase family protein [Vitreimonas sp.]